MPAPAGAFAESWIDLPESPFVMGILSGKTVLVNRSKKSWNSVYAGCVMDDGGRARVLTGSFGVDVDHGEYEPGEWLTDPLESIEKIDWYIANEQKLFGRTGIVKRCPEGARFAVVKATLRGQHEWSAEGTRWR